MNNYTERLELADGQWATLLTRLPSDRAHSVRVAVAREADAREAAGIMGGDPVFIKAVMKAHLLECRVKDYLTGEMTSDVDKADPRITDEIEAKAFVLYVEWSQDAYPGPKDSTAEQDSPTPTTPTTSEAPETSEQ